MPPNCGEPGVKLQSHPHESSLLVVFAAVFVHTNMNGTHTMLQTPMKRKPDETVSPLYNSQASVSRLRSDYLQFVHSPLNSRAPQRSKYRPNYDPIV